MPFSNIVGPFGYRSGWLVWKLGTGVWCPKVHDWRGSAWIGHYFEDSRVSGERNPGKIRRCRAQGRDGQHARRSDRGGPQALCRGRFGRRGQGADSRRRPRQGRRRQGGSHPRGCRTLRPEHSRHEADHPPDRPARPKGAAPAHRRDRGHRPRTLSRHRARSRQRQAGLHGLPGRRHGD